MIVESLKPSAPETYDIKTPDGFLRELFDRSKEMIETEKGAVMVADLEPRPIYRWDTFSTYPPGYVNLGVNLVKGLILRSDRHNYGLVLGERGFTNYDQSRLTFEFGKIFHNDKSFEEILDMFNQFNSDTNREGRIARYLSGIVHQNTLTYGSGRFYQERGTVEVECWVDKWMFGGREIGRWEYGRILSEAGLEASVDIVRELTNRSWR